MRSILQIELTNHCNRRCHYCGQSNMTRTRGFMPFTVVDRCIDIVQRLKQSTVGLNHYGESLLHPDFLSIVTRFNTAGIRPWLYTNGDHLPHIMDRLATLKMERLVISGHVSEAERQALTTKCLARGLPTVWQVTVADHCLDIAGQVPIPGRTPQPSLNDPMRHCGFLRDEVAIVLWNGDLVPCCFDYDGKLIFGNVLGAVEDVMRLTPQLGALCRRCPGHPAHIV